MVWDRYGELLSSGGGPIRGPIWAEGRAEGRADREADKAADRGAEGGSVVSPQGSTNEKDGTLRCRGIHE